MRWDQYLRHATWMGPSHDSRVDLDPIEAYYRPAIEQEWAEADVTLEQ